ncbi:AzlC family ABC transporter permease [uncultured Allobaculum sp.]|uniref:AzlC family ABC transporter permease n=1 Tax=uncultured Allobaculum sp. TaxID=1187017 RepID=UPI0025840B41|nr:AzlC family ABC transporter permease [uncultured Allobaculum sp.]
MKESKEAEQLQRTSACQNQPASAAKSKGAFRAGFLASVPIMLGYIPVAIAYAGMAQTAGMNFWQTLSLSLFVYTGAGQMTTASMLAQNAGLWTIVISVFVMNLRHIIMSMVVMEDLKTAPLWLRCVLSLGVTDEVFAMFTTQDHSKITPAFFGGLAFGAWFSWWVGTALGAVLCAFFPPVLTAAFAIAMPAMFLALLTPSLQKHARLWIPVLAAALFSWLASVYIEGSWNIVIGSLAGALIGLLFVKEEDV